MPGSRSGREGIAALALPARKGRRVGSARPGKKQDHCHGGRCYSGGRSLHCTTIASVSRAPLAFTLPISALLLLLAGLSLVTAVRGWSGSLPRSGRLGVHAAAAAAGDEPFRLANRVAAPVVGGAGVVALVLAALVVALPFPTTATVALGILAVVAVLLLLVAGGVLGEQAARTLPVPARRPQPTGACSGCACGGGGCAGLTRTVVSTDGPGPTAG